MYGQLRVSFYGRQRQKLDIVNDSVNQNCGCATGSWASNYCGLNCQFILIQLFSVAKWKKWHEKKPPQIDCVYAVACYMQPVLLHSVCRCAVWYEEKSGCIIMTSSLNHAPSNQRNILMQFPYQSVICLMDSLISF